MNTWLHGSCHDKSSSINSQSCYIHVYRYRYNKSSKFTRKSEANKIEFLENLEEKSLDTVSCQWIVNTCPYGWCHNNSYKQKTNWFRYQEICVFTFSSFWIQRLRGEDADIFLDLIKRLIRCLREHIETEPPLDLFE